MFYGICIIILLKKIVVAYFLSSNLNKFLKLQQAETNRFRHAPHRLMFIKQQKKITQLKQSLGNEEKMEQTAPSAHFPRLERKP
jgi:hypothetical protein